MTAVVMDCGDKRRLRSSPGYWVNGLALIVYLLAQASGALVPWWDVGRASMEGSSPLTTSPGVVAGLMAFGAVSITIGLHRELNAGTAAGFCPSIPGAFAAIIVLTGHLEIIQQTSGAFTDVFAGVLVSGVWLYLWTARHIVRNRPAWMR